MQRLIVLTVMFLVACSDESRAQGELQIPPKTAPEPVTKQAEPAPVQEKARTAAHNNKLECEWFTKISVSENGFNIEEAKATLETLENMRGSKDSLLSVMYRQSARITRQVPFTDTRQVWVSYLRMTGTEPPEMGWVECTGKDPETKKPTPAGCTGNWNATVSKWVDFRAKAAELYYSGLIPHVVDGKPIQWGGKMDYWRGAARGLCPLKPMPGFSFTNDYWGVPEQNPGKCLTIDQEKVEHSKVVSAAIASGRRSRQHLIPHLLGAKALIPGLGQGVDNGSD